MKNPLLDARHDLLPGPYATAPRADGIRPNEATRRLVQTQVQALLESSPSFRSLDDRQRAELGRNMEKIATYSAALMHDTFAQSRRLGQVPVIREQVRVEPAPSGDGRRASGRALAAEEFAPRAASQVAGITRDTLNAIAFPTFVADLIKGSFQAIVDSSIQQMQAYGELLANVAKTVDQFMADNITDNQARDYLAATYPAHFRVEVDQGAARVRMREGADERPRPALGVDMGVDESVDLDDETVEEVLVPAARRKLAQQRHQLLSTMVLMGINRIVVTSGKIRAQMGFHIKAHDQASAESASQFDFKHESSIGTGGIASMFGASVKSTQSIAYVTSTKRKSDDDLDVNADLTGEVELKFKSDYFPLERFADSQAISLIQGGTANPDANRPITGGSGGDGASGGSRTP